MARTYFKLDHDVAVARILAWFDRATPAQVTDGAAWYGAAYREVQAMSDASGFAVDTCAAVVSHLSPQVSWDGNKRAAWHVLTNEEGTKPSAIMWSSFERATKALHASDPFATFGKEAHKTRAFWAAILGNDDAVVIDVWATRIALSDEWTVRAVMPNEDGTGRDVVLVDRELVNILGRVGAYDQIADAYRAAARLRNVSPSAMQAITWVVARGSAS